MKHIYVAGTSSSAGKNTIALGLIRNLTLRGERVRPFKPITIDCLPTTAVADITPSVQLQCLAAGCEPSHLMNPVRVLFPPDNGGPILSILGKCVPFPDLQSVASLTKPALDAFHQLNCEGPGTMVIEGSGALDESDQISINAAILDNSAGEIILVSNEARGGGFASVIGTLTLIPENWRKRISTIVFNQLNAAQQESPLALWRKILVSQWGIPSTVAFPLLHGIERTSEDQWPITSSHVQLNTDIDYLAIMLEEMLRKSTNASA